ncbi:MAG: YdcF family protein [Alphaproteobacteria bacterium]|nr:YdcF family protein [Alphaproteobacteria bacterium]MCB9699051.1 YdcF family protein [Alphaproteobacteria bacterium]
MADARWLGAAVLGAPVAWIGAAVGLDLAGAGAPDAPPYEVVVVAGAGVMPDGGPSQALWARTRLAVDLYEAGVAPSLAFTGGVGDWGAAEAEVAADLARGWGVPEDALVLERTSTSTEENAANLRAIVGDRRVLVVTDRYHVFRCRRVFGRHFTDADAVGAVTPWAVRARGALREVAAVGVYALRGRL